MNEYYVSNGDSTQALLVVGAVFAGVGFLFLIVALIMLIGKRASDSRYTGRAYGQVIRILQASPMSLHSGMKSWRYYSPEIVYNVNGYDVVSHPVVYKYPCKYNVGQTLTVCFDPNNPQKMKIPEDKTVKILTIIFFSVSALLILLGGALMILGLIF